MSSPVRVRLSRKKGARMGADTLNVARPGKWGNPFTVDTFGLDLALTLYERSVTGYWTPNGIPDALIDEAYRLHTNFRRRFDTVDDTRNLRGWNLACWCKPDARCHADILLRLANPALTPLSGGGGR